MSEAPEVLWSPPDELRERATMTRYIRWLERERGLAFDGYDALCGAAEMSWTLTRATDTDAVVEYEREVSRAFRTADIAGLCQYDRRLFDTQALERLVATHEFQVTTDADALAKVSVTGKVDGIWSEVVSNGKARWVK